jgi:hypothetical protein
VAGIREEFDEIGYCCFTPEQLIAKPAVRLKNHKSRRLPCLEGTLQFETGFDPKRKLRLF